MSEQQEQEKSGLPESSDILMTPITTEDHDLSTATQEPYSANSLYDNNTAENSSNGIAQSDQDDLKKQVNSPETENDVQESDDIGVKKLDCDVEEHMDVADVIKHIDELGSSATSTSSISKDKTNESVSKEITNSIGIFDGKKGSSTLGDDISRSDSDSQIQQLEESETASKVSADCQIKNQNNIVGYELTENDSEDSNSRSVSKIEDLGKTSLSIADGIPPPDDEDGGHNKSFHKTTEENSGLIISDVVGALDESRPASEQIDAKKESEVNKKTISEKGQVDETKKETATEVKPVVPAKHESTDSATTVKAAEKSQLQCIVCNKVGKCKYNIVRNGDIKHLCDESCFQVFRANPTNFLRGDKRKIDASGGVSGRQCDGCNTEIAQSNIGKFSSKVGRVSKHFCQHSCLLLYQKQESVGKPCYHCKTSIRQAGSVIASFDDGILPLTKSFCSQKCFLSRKELSEGTNDVEIIGSSHSKEPSLGSAKCSVCSKVAPVKHEVTYNMKKHKLCGDSCFAAFRYANKLTLNVCETCSSFCNPDIPASLTIQFEGKTRKFCKPLCLSAFKEKKKRIVTCGWCSTRKPNFDMVERLDANNKCQLFCSLNCLSLFRVNLQATSNQSINCDQCKKAAPAQYHLTMSDASVRNFCSYNCVMAFQGQFATGSKPKQTQLSSQTRITTGNTRPSIMQQPTPTGARQSARVASRGNNNMPSDLPMISNVVSLAHHQKNQSKLVSNPGIDKQERIITNQAKIIVKPPPPKELKNKALLCKPFQQTKATSCRPLMQSKECQTEEHDANAKPVLVPVPVPYFVPVPMKMYTAPTPYPVPMPVPIPIPMFIPTTRKSADGILKQIQKIAESTPADPFEAELLMMAEAVAGAERNNSGSSDEDDTIPPVVASQSEMSHEQSDQTGEDLLQMAIRVASMPSDSVLDLEDTLQSNPINPSELPQTIRTVSDGTEMLDEEPGPPPRRGRGGRRRGRSGKTPKRARVDTSMVQREPSPPPVRPPPDANMVLKYTYGVNAWKHWVLLKNEQIEASSRKRIKKMKTELLQCTADELNYSLCLFVKEVRKPNGEEYAADSIYYLSLGIQQYLYENGRIDNIFADIYYEKFTDCLNEVLSTYEVRLNAQGLIVCRIEEEHLWESRQLGAHSPYVLMNTLIYFNTKYFMLRTPEDHLRLSFSHIMKHWKKTCLPGSKAQGRSVYLRYYAPVAGKEPGSKRKREDLPLYEQAENVENPLRCPVKLYEFYLSKCPESIKNRNDVFYLVPERSCVPDSPVWCSTQPLGIAALSKMLNRMLVVREIQEAHLHQQPM